MEQTPVNVFDINKICRVCLEEGHMISIYCSEYAISPLDMIVSCTSVKIAADNDDLPSSICSVCVYRLGVAFQFKQQCENSDMRLRECLGLVETDVPQLLHDKQVGLLKNEKQLTVPDVDNVLTNQTVSTNATQVKDEEIYAAMNAVYEILDNQDPVVDQVHRLDELSTIQVDATLPNQLAISNPINTENVTPSPPPVNNQSARVLKVNDHDVDQITVKTKISTKLAKVRKKSKHILQTPDRCVDCGKTFQYRGYLEAHMRTHTGERPFHCNICPLRFAQAGNLALHLRVHTGERPYQCELCSKLFTTSSNLKAHQRIHSNVKDYICQECGKSFRSLAELVSHSGTHTGRKDHVCKLCGKAFYKTSYLNVHFRTVHVGEKRHRCTECGKEFSNSSNLTCHFRIHTGEKPFSCKLCNAKFNQSSALLRHSKQHANEFVKMTNETLSPSVVNHSSQTIISTNIPFHPGAGLSNDNDEMLTSDLLPNMMSIHPLCSTLNDQVQLKPTLGEIVDSSRLPNILSIHPLSATMTEDIRLSSSLNNHIDHHLHSANSCGDLYPPISLDKSVPTQSIWQ